MPNRILRQLLILAFAAVASGLQAQPDRQTPPGIAWDVRGIWREGAQPDAIRNGTPLQPGALLEPAPSASDHSITILLPDGQRILYECFTVETCARGFRIPSLTLTPDRISSDFLARVRAAVAGRNAISSPDNAGQRLPQDEAVAVLDPAHHVQIAGLAAALQNGRYFYTVRSMGAPRPPQPARTLEKTSRTVTFLVPGPGLYDIKLEDSMKRPRIDLVVAAIAPPRQAAILNPFQKIQARLKEWNEDYQGWPVHDFQRAFLESLLLDIRPHPEHLAAIAASPRPGATAEPRFTPRPGAFRSDTQVTVQSDAGSVIHYTVDGSEPFEDSPAYEAPIMVKGTALTIKAFATAPGKKDSPVVTGIFRIEQQ